MIRFGQSPPPRGLWGRARGNGRIWMLLALLGGVSLLMRMLQQPEAAERLGQTLAMPTASLTDAPATSATGAAPPGDPAAWSAVRDNALFLPQEQSAWFALLEQVQSDAPRATAAPPPAVAYAQLVSQPDAYRGQLVRIRGTVVRESVKQVPKNDLGLDEYHQLIVAPHGGGEWPFVVYALELPEGFPRGAGLRAAVAIDGLFFKVWSYAHDDGAGLAPVIVARSIGWQPPAAAAPASARTAPLGPGASVVLAGAFAAGVVAWVFRQTRRASPAAAPIDDAATRTALRRLSDAEPEA